MFLYAFFFTDKKKVQMGYYIKRLKKALIIFSILKLIFPSNSDNKNSLNKDIFGLKIQTTLKNPFNSGAWIQTTTNHAIMMIAFLVDQNLKIG